MRKAVRAIVVRNDALLVMHRNKFGSKYCTLPGGGIKVGETAEQALHRKLREETRLSIRDPQLVFVEEASAPFGTQYIYLCRYVSGEVGLHPESEEAKIHAMGQNLYTPMWLPVKQLPDVAFVSRQLKEAIIVGLLHGFPEQPVEIKKS